MQSSGTVSSMTRGKKKKSYYPESLDLLFKKVDRIESSEEPEPVLSTSGMNEIAACPPSLLLTISSHLHCLVQSITLLPVHPMPEVVLYYCTFQGPVL